jgi:O-antigen/teichoic acid export membrane protein
VRQEAVFSAASISYLLSQAAIIVIMAWLGDVALLGAYGFATAVLTPPFFASRLGVDTVLAAGGRSSDQVGSILSATFTASVVLLVLTGLAAATWVLVVGSSPDLAVIFLIVGFQRLIENISACLNGYFVGTRSHGRAATSLFARAVIGPIAMLAGYWLTRSALFAIAMVPLAYAAVALISDLPSYRRLNVSLFVSGTQARIRALSPLGANAALVQFNNAAPRLFGGLFLSLEVLGGLMPALHLMTLIVAAANSMLQAMLPKVAALIVDNDRTRVRTAIRLTYLLGLALAIALVPISFLLGPAAITLVFGNNFGLAAQSIGWLAIACSLRVMANFLENAIIVWEDYGGLLRQNIYTTVIGLFLLPTIINVYGVMGLVAGVILTALFLLARLTLQALFMRSKET